MDERQQAQGEERLTGLQADPAVSDQQHHHAGGGQCFREVLQPGANQGAPVDQAEVVEDRIGLLTDRFSLPGDQFTFPHLNGGDPLLGEQVLQHPLAEGRVDAEVGAPLQGIGDQACA